MMDENSMRLASPRQYRTRMVPPASSLHEMNQSAANTRSNLPRPGQFGASTNTKPSGIAQPARPKTANPEVSRGTVSKLSSSTMKPPTKQHKLSSSVSSRGHHPPRPTSNNSFSATIGPGTRPQGLVRPQTAFGNYRNGSSTGRPGISMDTHDGDLPGSVLGKRKEDWDHEEKDRDFDKMYEVFWNCMNRTGSESVGLKEAVDVYKTRVNELEQARNTLNEQNVSLRVEVETMKMKLVAVENALRDAERDHEIALDDSDRQMRIEAETLRQEAQTRMDALAAKHRDELIEMRRQFETEFENEKTLRQRELSQLTSQRALDTQKGQIEIDNKYREIERLNRELQGARDDVEVEKVKTKELRQNLERLNGNSITLESSIRALKARIEFLESGSQEQSNAFARLDQELADALAETREAKEKLRKEETLRRKLHNQVQELKGNIRVFCRVRPSLNEEPANEVAQINFPDEGMDCKEISVLGQEEKSSLGVLSRKNNSFSFDRVFGPATSNTEVFEDISQLVQSALDGYNVCIFCYGQTGSGKTYTMSSEDGMIPRAVHQIYDTAQSLEERGWTYSMEGNFVEVYNENLNDLLGRAEEFDKKKHEIRHDMQKCKTTITDITTVTLDSPEKVESILRRAAANRSVAATKANERSSRSHSVFILRLLGENRITGERSEGTLNLVDLAGSERLSHSGATGDRLKETQNINRSLSCLGDVIGALGQGKDGGHIPYRNSKLTYLLQFSLGGNSKTLMFVMVSPLQAHLGETLTSLKFATKVHNTHIGTAKRQSRIKDA